MTKKTVDNESVNNKKDGSFIVGFLVGIIIMLVAIIVSFAYNIISFNNNKDQNKEESAVIKEEKEVKEEKEENKYVISYKDEEKEFKNSKGEVVITNKRNLPVITNSSNQGAAGNMVKYLTEVSNKNWEELNTNSYTKDDMLETLPKGVGVSYIFSTKSVKKNYISFEYRMSGNMGGVGWLGLWGYTFNTTSGNFVEYEDMVKDSSANEFIYNYVVDEIKKSDKEGSLWENNSGYKNWKEVVKEDMFKEGHFYLTDKGMKFTFDKYSLGPGSFGVPEVEVPGEKINNYLKDEYKY